MPKEYNWRCVPASKEKKKGRAMGGIITGVRKELKEEKETVSNKNIMERKVRIGNEIWRIFTVYSKCKEDVISLNEMIDETDENNLLIGGDFNARTGTEGGIIDEYKKERYTRKSKDRIINADGKFLLNEISERGWMILNGCEEIQETGEWTFIGKQGSSVIDYIITNSETCSKVMTVRVENRSESDHLPLVVLTDRKREIEEENANKKVVNISDWSEEGVEHYQNSMKDWKSDKEEENSICQDMEEQINAAKKL